MGILRRLLEEIKKRKLAGSSHSESHYDSLQNISASLFFWGLDFDVSRGGLDENLQHSDLLRETVLTVLVSIGQCISHRRVSYNYSVY
jgi:hypothetical protein